MSRAWIAAALMLAACNTVPEGEPVAAAVPDAGFETGFVPSLAARAGRPCGDIVGLSMSGPFTAAIIQLGEERSLVDATPEMVTCVEQNGLEVEFTS